MQVKFQEFNTAKSTYQTDMSLKKTDWGPQQAASIKQSQQVSDSLGFRVHGEVVAADDKKLRWWQWRKRCQVVPTLEEQRHLKSHPSSHQDKAMVLGGLSDNKTSWKKRKKNDDQTTNVTSTNHSVRNKQYKYLGFPNPAQICYMNASLQSLLTLEDFVEDISRQEAIWRSNSDAALIRALMNISACHSSSDVQHKISCLFSFKNTVSLSAPEFQDVSQKDAHEFLTSVLDQIRNLKPSQQRVAASVGRAYKCPVEHHFVFKMQNFRMCLTCKMKFTRDEEFTNLSLDLLPGIGTVEQMIQNYLKRTLVEFQCECGSNTSLQHSSFISLPKVLVLHLKRFVFFSVFGSIKVRRPVCLTKDLVVTSRQGGACYSLVSVINHTGFTTTSGKTNLV
ncbi:ubiquitin carboxyl-terminal hydrolase 37-like [Nerophis lumbriciformis]|uniref:ubiquitin carboxyl-terminal hydrolase 37-like n=1 Tax=Nerophis lumbriciformis TaxID=546530 RepID=UPI002ADFBE0F|nr:ubiquitin carboxyl-terminal hydrolase 37-like [Nerophis lumbriciformis]